MFLLCALAGAACTVAAWAMVQHFTALLLWRAATGFFLAGIYPVGMKIAAQWYRQGLGAALGLLLVRWCWARPAHTACAPSAASCPGPA